MAEHPRGAVLRRAIETCIAPDDAAIAKLGELFTDDATVWSPNMLAVGLADLAENLAFREAAFSDVDIQIDSLDIFGSRGLAEFRVAATFSGPFVIDEAAVIDPNGQQLLLGAAAVADFEGDKIKALRAYFDDATLLEQMLDDVGRADEEQADGPLAPRGRRARAGSARSGLPRGAHGGGRGLGRRRRRGAGVRGLRRATTGGSSPAPPARSGAAAARCTSCGSTTRSGVMASARRSWPRSSTRRGDEAAAWSWASPTTS